MRFISCQLINTYQGAMDHETELSLVEVGDENLRDGDGDGGDHGTPGRQWLSSTSLPPKPHGLFFRSLL